MVQYTIIPPFDHMGTVGSGGDIVVIYPPKTPMIARFFVQIVKEQTNTIPSKMSIRQTTAIDGNTNTPSAEQKIHLRQNDI